MIANFLQDKDRERVPERQEGLGAYCRRLRGERTLTDVAKRAGMQVSSLKRIEDGQTKRLKSRTLAGLAIALEIPQGYLQAAMTGEPVREEASLQVCPSCWVPGSQPDALWSVARARFCCLCGTELRDRCGSCGHAIENWHHKFCPECGKPYGDPIDE